MGLCSPSVADNNGRITIYTSATRPTSGDDFYIGKVIFESDTNKLMLCTSIAAGGTWRELADGDGWTPYTPTVSGFTQGNGTVTGAFRLTVTHYDFYATFTYGSTSTALGNLGLTAPVAMTGTATWDGATSAVLGGSHGLMYDLSTTIVYPLDMGWGSSTVVTLQGLQYNGAAAGTAAVVLVPVGGAFPVAPATGDVYSISVRSFIA